MEANREGPSAVSTDRTGPRRAGVIAKAGSLLLGVVPLASAPQQLAAQGVGSGPGSPRPAARPDETQAWLRRWSPQPRWNDVLGLRGGRGIVQGGAGGESGEGGETGGGGAAGSGGEGGSGGESGVGGGGGGGEPGKSEGPSAANSGKADLPDPFPRFFEAINPARAHHRLDEVLGFDAGEQSNKPEAPEIPLAVFVEVIRPLGGLKYENEANYFIASFTGNAPTLQTVTYEYVFADWNAFRLELTYPNGKLEALVPG